MMSYKTISAICRDKWPRMLPITWAAAYCGMTLTKFRAMPQFNNLVVNVNGDQLVDKNKLDHVLDNIQTEEKVCQ